MWHELLFSYVGRPGVQWNHWVPPDFENLCASVDIPAPQIGPSARRIPFVGEWGNALRWLYRQKQRPDHLHQWLMDYLNSKSFVKKRLCDTSVSASRGGHPPAAPPPPQSPPGTGGGAGGSGTSTSTASSSSSSSNSTVTPTSESPQTTATGDQQMQDVSESRTSTPRSVHSTTPSLCGGFLFGPYRKEKVTSVPPSPRSTPVVLPLVPPPPPQPPPIAHGSADTPIVIRDDDQDWVTPYALKADVAFYYKSCRYEKGHPMPLHCTPYEQQRYPLNQLQF